MNLINTQKDLLERPLFIADEVIKYRAETRQLYGSLFDKAVKFVNYDCVHYLGKHTFTGEGNAFLILPLNSLSVWTYQGQEFEKKPFPRDYNFTPYVVTVTYDFNFKHNFLHCSCQGWQAKDLKGEFEPEGVMCSHALALKLFWKRQYFERLIMRGAGVVSE